MQAPIVWQWALLILFGIGFFFLVPVARQKEEFFAALSEKGRRPGFWMLTSSLVISWIFAKSITNAANLGLQFGFVGGVAYAVYYLSFLVAGIVIYQLRVKGGFKSIHQFLQRRFGRAALVVFSLLIGIRLFNEVWSNTMVIGSYFGAMGSRSYYAAILVFTALTLAYVLKGGLRSSLLTDAIQMVLFGVLLFLLLRFILPQTQGGIPQLVNSGDWTMATGLNLLFAALLQVFSYPFHDPVMTDRGFISDAKTTLRSYVAATFIGFFCLVVFSFVGVFARFEGLEGQAAVAVSQLLGVGGMLVMNFIMVTSAASTLDSTFSSFAKLVVIDLEQKKRHTVRRGRLMMILLAIAGTLPIFASPEILSATTVSGTMVMGLAPVFLLWKIKAPRLSFHLSVGFGLAVGILLALDQFPQGLVFTTGKYAALLWANVWGLLGCFLLFILPLMFNYGTQKNN
ncbi:MAG: sodium:solute symporter [Bacteroidota bacterium]